MVLSMSLYLMLMILQLIIIAYIVGLLQDTYYCLRQRLYMERTGEPALMTSSLTGENDTST